MSNTIPQTNSLHDLLIEVRKTDTTEYMRILNDVKSMEAYEVIAYLKNLNEKTITKLSDSQVFTLYSLAYKGGCTYTFYRHSSNTNPMSPYEARQSTINNGVRTHRILSTKDSIAEDLPYMSTYHVNKWRKENPTTTRAKKGINFQPEFNEFSLIIFKDSIKKPFTRNEAKNRVLSVNKVFNSSNGDEEAIRFRNKYYKLILDNTDYHTKAMINSLHTTQLYTYVVDVNNRRTQEKVYYVPHPDEALAIQIDRWNNADMQPYSNVDSRDSYSTDLTIAAGSKAELSYRDAARYATASGVFTNMYTETNCEAYKTMATTIINTIDDDTKQQMLSALKGANKLYELIKEQ